MKLEFTAGVWYFIEKRKGAQAMKEVYDHLRKNGTFYVATVEGDRPRVRPFGAVMLKDQKLYFSTNNQKDVYRQILENPKVEICSVDADGVNRLRIAGRAVIEDCREVREAMLEAVPALKSLYAPDDGKMTVFYLADVVATFSSRTAPPRIIEF